MPLPPPTREYTYGNYGSDLYGGIIWDLKGPPDVGAAEGEEVPETGSAEPAETPDKGDAE